MPKYRTSKCVLKKCQYFYCHSFHQSETNEIQSSIEIDFFFYADNFSVFFLEETLYFFSYSVFQSKYFWKQNV